MQVYVQVDKSTKYVMKALQHKIMYETIERMLFQIFQKTKMESNYNTVGPNNNQ